MTTPAYTAEQLALLSDEEKAGLLAEQADDEARAAAGIDPDAEPEVDEIENPPAPAPEPAPAPAPAPAAEPAADPTKTPAPEPEPAPAPAPGDVPEPAPAPPATPAPAPAAAAPRPFIPDWQMPQGGPERITAIDAALDKLATDFEAGEITASDMTKQQRTLNDERAQINEAIFKATFATDSIKSHWRQTVQDFFGQHDAYKEPDSSLRLAFGEELKRLQVGKTVRDQTDPKLLAQADANLRKRMGMAPATAAAPAGAVPLKTGQREPAPSLAHVPAADIEDIGGSDFSHLDRLSGEAYEKALAAMSPADRDRYLEGA